MSPPSWMPWDPSRPPCSATVMEGSSAPFRKRATLNGSERSSWRVCLSLCQRRRLSVGDVSRKMVFFEGVIEKAWGNFEESDYVSILAPSVIDDSRFRAWFDTLTKLGASPSAAIELLRIFALGDIRAVLPTISVPTLVLQRTEDPLIGPAHGRYFAEHVSGATYLEIPGRDDLINVGDVDRIADEIQHFLTGVRAVRPPERILATVMFTDIVGFY